MFCQIFSDVKQNNYQDAVQKIKNIIVDAYRQHRYLEQEECFTQNEKQQMLEITEKSGVHLQISHLKLMGKSQWGKGAELLKKITDARARGLNITCDQYPFTASSTSLTALMPHWSHEGGTHKMMERLRAREETLCEEIGREMNNRGGADTILISGTHGCRPEYE